VSNLNYPKIVAYLYLGDFNKVENELIGEGGVRSAIYSFPVTDAVGTIRDIRFKRDGKNSVTEIWKHTGEKIHGTENSMDRLGCVITLAVSKNLALDENREIMNSFTFEID
jgi:hypothetical protein